MNAETMRKAVSRSAHAEIKPGHDFSGGVRGKYARRCARSINVVVLEPDVAEPFPNAAAVNRSLRALAALVRQHQKAAAAR